MYSYALRYSLSALTDFIHSLIKSLSIQDRSLLNVNTPAPKVGENQMVPKTQNGFFLENGCNNIDQIPVTCGEHIPK
jgi:hypothetical protein